MWAHRIQPYSLALTVLALLAAGCTTPHGRIPLSEETRNHLAERGKSTEELGLELVQDRHGNTALDNIHNIPLGMSAMVPLNAHPSKEMHQPVVHMRLNEQPVLGLVDTSAATSLIDVEGAQRVGLNPVILTRLDSDGSPVSYLMEEAGYTPGGMAYQLVALARSVALGDLKVYNVPLGILDDERGLRWMWWLNGHRVDAVVGYDLLKEFDRVTLDFANRQMQLASGRYRPDPQKLIAAMPLVPKFAIPVVEATIDGHGPYLLALNTGGDFGLWLPYGIAEEMNLPELEDIADRDRAADKGRLAPYTQVGSRTVNVSGFEVADVSTLLGPAGQGEDDPPFGLLGIQVLNAYVTTIDHKARKVYFERH